MEKHIFEEIIFDIKNNLGLITLNHPEGMNALSPNMLREIHQVLDLVQNGEEIRVLVITGSGRTFCTGADVKAMAKGEIARSMQRSYHKPQESEPNLNLRLQAFDKPVIAAVNGYAVGGGLDLALACDLRISSDRARFAEVYIRRGLIPADGGSFFVPALVKIDKACEVIWTGDMLEPQEALQIGLVTRVVPHERLLEEALALGGRIAENDPYLVSLTKKMIYQFWRMSLSEANDKLKDYTVAK